MSEPVSRESWAAHTATRVELLSFGDGLGPRSGEIIGTISLSSVVQWRSREEPGVVVELTDYHMFDVRIWCVRGADPAAVERVAALLPTTPRARIRELLASEDLLARMQGLRAATILREPWAAVADVATAMLDSEEPALRWCAFRSFGLGRWPEAAAVLRRARDAGHDRLPEPDFLGRLAHALEPQGSRTKKKKKKKKKTMAKKT